MTTTKESPSPPEPGPEPPARLRGLVSWQANKVAVLGARMTARQMPLTARSEFAVLASLEQYGSLSQADLGRRLGLDRNDVSGTVGRLVDHGYVDRRPDPDDRRRNLVSLTTAGHERLDEIQRYADTAQAELLAGLEPDERTALGSLLTKLLASHGPQDA